MKIMRVPKIDDGQEKSKSTTKAVKRELHKKKSKILDELEVDEHVKFGLLGQIVEKVCKTAEEGWIENNIRIVIATTHSVKDAFLTKRLRRQINQGGREKERKQLKLEMSTKV